MSKCTKCGTNFIGTAASPPKDGPCRYCEMDKLRDAMDMQRDEFKRIIALCPSTEIIGICERAATTIEQTVPVVVQLDKLQSTNAKLRSALVGIVGADGSELGGMELALRLAPMPAKDKAVTIDAIHALLETLPV